MHVQFFEEKFENENEIIKFQICRFVQNEIKKV